ncbi:conserved hypothetical protein [Theileria orientalis strain Shintoku]|uniref:RAP domain-containing protein n=1 Tax=Theileria orientalis strain Shintoku TaxID=869250 RepID=J4D776_THEOR|nr:conserved hypothetical protein [Theileria orientalis strain Shintoku]BAM40010.1 conserved hypothetical protein [Theileria orientalis strain Shintoku]|eukprot:XP_009690311.1 conserved hypothetical protein [Theileria orientalis strain Shintoku]
MMFNRLVLSRFDPGSFPNSFILKNTEILSNTSHIFNSSNKRYFTHYRFHKRIGKGNWNRYVERYTKPASIENTQPIYFNYKASYQSTKNSVSYLWELPKRIAASTTSNQLLESWVYYRHKRKKLYHYVMALKRLNEIKQIDISDWRFKLIISKVVKRARQDVNVDLPAVCYYLGNLKCVEALEKVTYHLIERMEYYSPLQLGRIASAFSSCRLFNKYLFSLLSTRFRSLIEIASNSSIISVTQAFANCMVYNFSLFNTVSFEFQRRVNRDILHTKERMVNTAHLTFSFKPPKEPPSLSELVELGECFATAKYKDLGYFNMLSALLVDHVNQPDQFDPVMIAKAISVYSTLKINDIPLMEEVLKKVHATPYNFPPAHMASMLRSVSSMISRTLKIYHSLTDVAIFAHNVGLSKPELLSSVVANLIKNARKDRSEYDAPKLFEVITSKIKLDGEAFNLFCYQTRRLLSKLEPCDFMRAARVMRRLKREDMTDVKLLNLMALRLAEVSDEFNARQYNSVITDLTLSGNIQREILRSMWLKNTLVGRNSKQDCRYPRGFKPTLEGVQTS